MGKLSEGSRRLCAAAAALGIAAALACAACSPASADVRAGDGAAGPQALRDEGQAGSDGGAGGDAARDPGSPSRPFTVAQAEAMTPADVVALEEAGFTRPGKRYPEGFGVPEADPYGYALGSAGSADGARDAVDVRLHPNGYDGPGSRENTLLSCEVEEDFGLAWGVRYEYEHRPYTPQKGSYGNPVRYGRTGLVFDSGVYDVSGRVMGTRDPAAMRRALDETLRCSMLETGGCCVVATGIREGAPGTPEGDAAWESPEDAVAREDGTMPEGWTYRAYVLKTVYGDWGMSDEAMLVRYSARIDAATGAVSQPEEAVIATASGNWGGYGDAAM